MTTAHPPERAGDPDDASRAGAAPPGDDTDAVLRRAPFSTNPRVGERGQRTQQRILDAALQVFGEAGYHQCSIDRIAKVAGCSRISFYQYFSSKEDVFRHLAGQIARQITASIDALSPVTADAAGWDALRAWVSGYGDLHERYRAVFSTFQAAVETDEAVAGGSLRAGARNVARFRTRLVATAVPARHLDATVDLLMKAITASFGIAATLRSAAPEDHPRDRMDDAATDVFHRSLFGLLPGVNVHPPGATPPAALAFGPAMLQVLDQRHDVSSLTPAGRRTYDSLLRAGRTELVQRGFHGTRVDDIAAAAGLSHGAFYRYFDNKDQFARLLAGDAMRTVSTAFAGIPTAAVHDRSVEAGAALRSWMRHYNTAQASEAALIRVWADAFHDPEGNDDSAAVFDWGRRQMAGFLRPRGFGDVETEAIVLVGLLEAFGARPRSPAATDLAASIIETGLLGRWGEPSGNGAGSRTRADSTDLSN